MKTGFYPRLALTGMRKNKRLYVPYIATCIGMVMMYYIITFLAGLELLLSMRGGDTLVFILDLGSRVMAVFSAIFLFYTNSFLIRRRKKEFGLYNILGMDKKNIAVVLFWETLIIAVIALAAGLFAGVSLSKFAELSLINIVQGEVNHQLTFSVAALKKALLIFGVIFVLIYLNTLRQIHMSNPIALLHSENVGEKPPKANWFLGVLGVVLLGGAYYIAVSIEDPLVALLWFFVAVIMVILGTYLLFMASSVLLCRILRKSKSYYYKANHFVSVSSMTYRMKRNAAGLASICILSTMVLVMLAGSSCLYFGEEDILQTRYPREIVADIGLNSLKGTREENISQLQASVEQVITESGVTAKELITYRYADIYGVYKDGVLETNPHNLGEMDIINQSMILYFVPLADYNRAMNANEQLADNEILVYMEDNVLTEETLTIENKTFQIKKVLNEFMDEGFSKVYGVASVYVVVPDLEAALSEPANLQDSHGNNLLMLYWYYGFDTNTDKEAQKALAGQIREYLRGMNIEGQYDIYSYGVNVRSEHRDDFHGTFGGLFFLGILLSIVFIFATVLIMYYKQISEGYEDCGRFEIMQKVGMTKKDIHKSINSQMLTVFALPLVTAAVHLAFAFPMISKLLILFNLTNVKLLILTTIICVAVFGLLYVFVYRITSNAYFKIVSEGE